ncbi:MAG: copper resistance protein CopC [Mycobacterium sp.]|nr:copper resistance protein CopC [Mycobacterium sp.]
MLNRHRWLRPLACVLGLISVSVAPVAGAHADRVGTDPAAGSTVGSTGAQVAATFDEPLESTFASMSVVGPDGATWSTGDVVSSGNRLSVGVRTSGPAGVYTVAYRFLAADGHVVTGSWSYSVEPESRP